MNLDDFSDLFAQVARELAQARQKQGLTQSDLAKRVGMAQADISKLESGQGNPSLKTLQRVAEGLGLHFELSLTPREEEH